MWKYIKILFYLILIFVGGSIPLFFILGYFLDDGTIVMSIEEEVFFGVVCAMIVVMFVWLMIFAIKRLMNMKENERRLAEKKEQSILFEDLPIEVRMKQRNRMEQQVEKELTYMFAAIPLTEEESTTPPSQSQPVYPDHVIDNLIPVGRRPINKSDKSIVRIPSPNPWSPKENSNQALEKLIHKKEDYGITNDLAKLYGRTTPMSAGNKWLWGIIIFVSVMTIGTISVLLINQLWPRDRFSPEVDAAFVSGVVTSLVSMVTITITVGFTVVTNKKSNEALMNQSRASIRDDFLRQRMQIYPFLQKYNRICRKLIRHHEIDEEKLVLSLNQFYEYYMEHRLYISRQIREQILLLFSTCMEEEEDWIGVKDFYQFAHASMILDQIIDQELDLVAIDRDIRMLANQ